MDRTRQLSQAVTEALGAIVDSWGPDRAELVVVNNMTNLVMLTWPPGSNWTVVYKVQITREQDLPADYIQEEHGRFGVIS